MSLREALERDTKNLTPGHTGEFLARRLLMRGRLLRVFAITAGLLAISLPLFAHHGNSNFDSGKKITMKGTVSEWFWANPHCFLKFDVTDAGGNVVHWVAETSNPPDMINRGWSKLSLKPGDQVTVTVEPVKNGSPIGRVLQVVLPNGQILGTGGAAPGEASPKP
jgi:hypothetical protein